MDDYLSTTHAQTERAASAQSRMTRVCQPRWTVSWAVAHHSELHCVPSVRGSFVRTTAGAAMRLDRRLSTQTASVADARAVAATTWPGAPPSDCADAIPTCHSSYLPLCLHGGRSSGRASAFAQGTRRCPYPSWIPRDRNVPATGAHVVAAGSLAGDLAQRRLRRLEHCRRRAGVRRAPVRTERRAAILRGPLPPVPARLVRRPP